MVNYLFTHLCIFSWWPGSDGGALLLPAVSSRWKQCTQYVPDFARTSLQFTTSTPAGWLDDHVGPIEVFSSSSSSNNNMRRSCVCCWQWTNQFARRSVCLSLSAYIRADVRTACAANATITSCQFQSRDKPARLHCTRLAHVRSAAASESYSVLILKTAVWRC